MLTLFLYLLVFQSEIWIGFASSLSSGQKSLNSNKSKGQSPTRRPLETITKPSGEWETFDEASFSKNSNTATSVVRKTQQTDQNAANTKPAFVAKRSGSPPSRSSSSRSNQQAITAIEPGLRGGSSTQRSNQQAITAIEPGLRGGSPKQKSNQKAITAIEPGLRGGSPSSRSTSSSPQAIVPHLSDSRTGSFSTSSRQSGYSGFVPNGMQANEFQVEEDPYRGPISPAFSYKDEYIISKQRGMVERAYVRDKVPAKEEIRNKLAERSLQKLEYPPVIGLHKTKPTLMNTGKLCVQDSAIEALQLCYPEHNFSGVLNPIQISHEITDIRVMLPHIVNVPAIKKFDKEFREAARAKQEVIKCTYVNARVEVRTRNGFRVEKKTLELYMADIQRKEVIYFYPFDSDKTKFMPIIHGIRGENMHGGRRLLDYIIPKYDYYGRKAGKLRRDPSFDETNRPSGDTENSVLAIEYNVSADSYGDVKSARASGSHLSGSHSRGSHSSDSHSSGSHISGYLQGGSSSQAPATKPRNEHNAIVSVASQLREAHKSKKMSPEELAAMAVEPELSPKQIDEKFRRLGL